jgi:hypothetical protein
MGADMSETDRRTDMTKLIVAFHYFENATNKLSHSAQTRYFFLNIIVYKKQQSACFYCEVRNEYIRAPVSTDSVSAVYRGQKK